MRNGFGLSRRQDPEVPSQLQPPSHASNPTPGTFTPLAPGTNTQHCSRRVSPAPVSLPMAAAPGAATEPHFLANSWCGSLTHPTFVWEPVEGAGSLLRV